jgi:hypothetical protein
MKKETKNKTKQKSKKLYKSDELNRKVLEPS